MAWLSIEHMFEEGVGKASEATRPVMRTAELGALVGRLARLGPRVGDAERVQQLGCWKS